MDLGIILNLLDCQDKAYKSALEMFLEQVSEGTQSCETLVKDSTSSRRNESRSSPGEVRQTRRQGEDSKLE